jgi:uncharacterized repeat protein (TIGR03847 family)
MTDDLGTVVLVTGAIGEPGQRVFYLQAQGPLGTHTVKCEKGQVAALAEHLEQLLADLPAIGAVALVPTDLETGPGEIVPRFVLGTIGLAYDADADRVVVVLEELATVDEDDDPVDIERDGLRLEITRGVASVFCARAKEIVAAGRPSCRWCGRPIDLDGHPCPRMN